VTGWAGPWPVVERWWGERGGAGPRAYLQARLEGDDPQAVLLVHDGEWLLDAVYD
jgi:protein ImuB